MAGWTCFCYCEQETNYILLENFMATISRCISQLIWAGWIGDDALWSNSHHGFGAISPQNVQVRSPCGTITTAPNEWKHTWFRCDWIACSECILASIVWDGRGHHLYFSISLVLLLSRKTNEECLPKSWEVRGATNYRQRVLIFAYKSAPASWWRMNTFPKRMHDFGGGRWKIAADSDTAVYTIRFICKAAK